MNNQEIFDKVVQHARKQNKKAIRPDGRCKYRTKDGLKCFIGILIPDDKYDPSFEGLVPLVSTQNFNTEHCKNANKFNNALIELGFSFDQYHFFSKLQQIHDYNPVDKWEEEFQSFAETYNLIYNPPA